MLKKIPAGTFFLTGTILCILNFVQVIVIGSQPAVFMDKADTKQILLGIVLPYGMYVLNLVFWILFSIRFMKPFLVYIGSWVNVLAIVGTITLSLCTGLIFTYSGGFADALRIITVSGTVITILHSAAAVLVTLPFVRHPETSVKGTAWTVIVYAIFSICASLLSGSFGRTVSEIVGNMTTFGIYVVFMMFFAAMFLVTAKRKNEKQY